MPFPGENSKTEAFAENRQLAINRKKKRSSNYELA